MQVGPDHVARVDALEAVAAVVAVPLEHPPERALAAAEVGPPAVVLEAGDDARAAAEVGLDRAVADQPRSGLAHRPEVDEADARQLLAAELVGVAEQLVAAAHRAARRRRARPPRAGRRASSRPCRARSPPGRGPGRRRCRRGRARPGRARRRCPRRRARSRGRATRSARAARRCCRGRRRCSSGPDRASRPSAPALDHHASDVVGRLRDLMPRDRLEPRGARLALELAGIDHVERERSRLLVEPSRRARRPGDGARRSPGRPPRAP